MKNHKLLLALLPVFLTAPAFAQTNGGTGKGLDHLDESLVMEQLATANLNALLNRDMDAFKVPQTQRDQMGTLPLLHQLMNPIGLNVSKRHELAVRVASGLDGILPKENNAKSLLDLTNELYSAGVLPTQTEMEYFGENPTTQNQLKPVVETCKKMFEKVESLALAELDVVANKIKTPAQFTALKPQMDALRMIKFEAEYTDNMAAYSLCLSIPQGPDRKKIADPAITYLSDYDNPQSTVQPVVRMQIAKLQLAEGDFAKAKGNFDSIANNPNNVIVPAPTLDDQNNARYFAIVSQIQARKLPAAETDIQSLEKWQQTNYLPALKPAEQNEVKASMAMLKFRLLSTQADLAAAPAVHEDLNNKAMDVLSQLLKEQPGLKDLVFDQLIGRIPANADLATLPTLLLQGFRQLGFDELHRPEGDLIDKKKLQRAIDSSVELIKRKGQPGVDTADVDKSAYFLGYAYERMDEDKLAAAAFLDYAEKFAADKGWAADAVNHAGKWIFELRKKSEDDADIRALYDRFLPLAIAAPYNHKDLAFRYAKLLKQEQKYAQAITYYKMVPKTDPSYPDAQLQELQALSQALGDQTLAPDARKDIVNQIVDLARVIDGLYSSATSEADKKIYVQWAVVADECAASLTRSELKDPAKSLKILDGFEDRVAASADPAKAHTVALQIRIGDYMDSGNINQAVKELLALLNTDQTAGQGLMFSVLDTVSRDMDAAKTAGNKDEVKKLAQDKADLSAFVVDWASKNKDPKVLSQLPIFQRFDADSQKDAAELIDDPSIRREKLTDALHKYQAIVNTPNNEQLQLAAQQGIGLVQFDLQNYDEAIKFLSPLVTQHKVGEAMIMDGPPGAQHEVDNPQFWQANYELIKSMVESAKKNPRDSKSAETLKNANSYLLTQYVIYGNKTGGTQYHDDYEKLKTELAKLVPPASAAASGATTPAPAAAAAGTVRK
jgi:hypothetical protein